MDNEVVILTACDQKYFHLCVDLIASIKAARGAMPRMRVLDVGMLPSQTAVLAKTVEMVVEPTWDIGEGMNLPIWYRAMTARPFLPKYAGDAAVVAWIDSDAWIQRFEPLEMLISAARGEQLAIVEERFGKGFSVVVQTGPGTSVQHVYNTQSVKAITRSVYERCFDSEIATAFGELPSFNSGVFALRTDSPSWKLWQETCTGALARSFHFLAEQASLNVAIRQGRIPVSPQCQEANFTCHLELPWFSVKDNAYTIPGNETCQLGIIHLCDSKNYSLLPIPRFPYGDSHQMPLIYSLVQKVLNDNAKGIQSQTYRRADRSHMIGSDSISANWGMVSRNQLCHCGSGKKYKHCHGRL